MNFTDIEKLEESLSREELVEFNKAYMDISLDLQAKRGYDNMFMYSPFYDMNIRTAVYLGYLMGLKKSQDKK